ncbi:glycosyltransferase [Achromobacter marplatensis]|uniref:glycosyltransferase n=1 Tax=Achromobacter marplatensis TaxID=470868 RepID=UPI003C780519
MHAPPLTICDTTQAFAETSGGIKTYLLEKRRHILERTDHRHVLIIPGREDRTTHEGRATTHEIEAPEIRGYAPYRFIFRLDKVMRRLRESAPDVIETSSPYILPWAALRYRRKNPRCAVLGYYHTDYPTAYVGTTIRQTPAAPLERLAVGIAKRYARAVFRRFDRALTASPVLDDALRRIGVDGIALIPLGVDLETFHPRERDRTVWASHGIDPNRPVMLFCGRLDTEKRIAVLVDAMRDLADRPELQLAFVGDGPGREMLERERERDPRLFVLPYQSEPPALARLLASADLYVTAGPHETFGLSVVEAQACGLPLVGVAAGALIDRVPPEVGRLGPADDSAAFAANIRAIFAEDLAAIGTRARNLVAEHFAWSRTFETLIEVYRETLAHRPADGGRRVEDRSGVVSSISPDLTRRRGTGD